MDNNQIFRNDFVCIHYHLCKITPQIIDCQIIAPYDFLKMNYLQHYLLISTIGIVLNAVLTFPARVLTRA